MHHAWSEAEGKQIPSGSGSGWRQRRSPFVLLRRIEKSYCPWINNEDEILSQCKSRFESVITRVLTKGSRQKTDRLHDVAELRSIFLLLFNVLLEG
jgi:hypothetical protein